MDVAPQRRIHTFLGGFGLILSLVASATGQELQDVIVTEPIANGAEADSGDRLVHEDVTADLLSDDGELTSSSDLVVEHADDELDALLEQDISTLRTTTVAPALDVEVSTVSRQTSTIGRSPAAVYVISQEMIRRSGARSIPEALRLAPGLQVARIDSNKWSISSRGFSGRFSNKLLVQIDGRTVYSPLFAGTFWDIQDVLLDDILRIEVIRGPGATVWGANAVNGVINIITKSAAETHGVYAMAGGGTEEEGFAGARVGGRTTGGVDWRVSGKWFERDNFFEPLGREYDHWDQGRVSYRADWNPTCCDSLTLLANYYNGKNRNAAVRPYIGTTFFDEPVSGTNVLTRWTRRHGKDSDATFQFYYDRTNRDSLGFDQKTNTLDFDYQRRFSLNRNNKVIWGMGYRRIWDELTNDLPPFFISVVPEQFTVERVSAFIQDEVTLLTDSLYLTLGTKLSYNTYTDVEVQPNVRLLWLPTERSAAWASISRAVRTPSRATEHARVIIQELPLPGNPPLVLFGNELESESLIAYEFGYREQTTDNLSWDFAAFYNYYDDVTDLRLITPPLALPFVEFFNGVSADTFGFEISAQAQMSRNWKLHTWYTFLYIDAHLDPQSSQTEPDFEDIDPRNQFFLMSSWDIGCYSQFDLIARYVDTLRAFQVPSYWSLDARYSVRLANGLDATVVGQNLLDSHHPEYGTNQYTGDIVTEVPRGVYGVLEWRY